MISIINSKISDDLVKDDDVLSFNIENTIEYDFDESTDKFIQGAGAPQAYVGIPSNEIADEGYILKKVAEEDFTVEVYLGSNDNYFYEKSYHINYYIQTKDTSGGDEDVDRDEEEDGNDDNEITGFQILIPR